MSNNQQNQPITSKVRNNPSPKGPKLPLPHQTQDVLDNPTRIRRYQYTSFDQNSNKFYDYYIKTTNFTDRVHVVVRFGRVGDEGQVRDYGVLDERELTDKIYDRQRKGYKEVDLAGTLDARKAGANAPALSLPAVSLSVQSLSVADGATSYIFSEAGEAIQQYLNTSVDTLSYAQISKARGYLTDIEQLRKQLSTMSSYPAQYKLNSMGQLVDAVEHYYITIPTKLPRKIDPAQVAQSFDVSEQETRLDQLEAAIASLAVTSKGGTQTQALGATLVPLTRSSLVARSLFDYIERTTSSSRIDIVGIYEIEVPQERAAYKARKVAREQDKIQLLFHGTRNPNMRHILRSGLIIPRTAANGRALGDGIYFGNKAQKAINYCATSGGSVTQNGHIKPKMMLVSEVAMGRTNEIRGGHYSPHSLPGAGYESVHSHAHSSYAFDELVVYRPEQTTIRYLVFFR